MALTTARFSNPSAAVSSTGFADSGFNINYGTAAEWAAVSPVLAKGEPAYELDTGIVKVGDGVTRYTSLNQILNGSAAVIDGGTP